MMVWVWKLKLNPSYITVNGKGLPNL